MTTLRILMVQTAIDWNDPAANRARLQSMLEKHAGSYDLVVLPETFTTGFLGGEGGEGESMDGPTVAWMQDTCARYGGALAGSMVIGENGNRYNRFLFATADGIRAHYDKRHLFSYGGEDGHYTAGSDRVNVDYLGWRINLQVCYDLRFPAWCRYRGDYDLMLLVANWPVRRIHHWSTLLEARAIENQSCVVGLNRVGKDGHADALAQPHAREMDFTGRPLSGMVYVDPEGLAMNEDLDGWVARGFAFASSLPPKPPKKPKAKKPRKAR